MLQLGLGLVRWFAKNHRPLPWRSDRTPYSVWVSEVMLQQTTVATVVPRFIRWMKRFPTIRKLASASEREVLREWEGLGYYSRARNLLKAARFIVKLNKGRVPDTFEEIRKLPGIGGYTASAILSIAFNKLYPVVDANVKRVMARLFNRKTGAPGFDAFTLKKLGDLMPPDRPGDFNEALMELGQTTCLGSDPLCGECPLAGLCLSRKAGTQEQVLGSRKRVVRRLKTRVLILLNQGRVLIRRSEGNLMKSLWKFPGIPVSGPVKRYLVQTSLSLIRSIAELTPLVHHYTIHQEQLLPMILEVRGRRKNTGPVRWARLKDLDRYPMPSVYRKIAVNAVKTVSGK